MRLMIVDDNRQIREGIHYGIEWERFGITNVSDYADGAEAAKELKAEEPDIIIADIKMPDMDGLELLGIVKKKLPDCRYILLSAYSEFSYAQKAIKLGADDYILKPVKPDTLIETVMKNAKVIASKMKERDTYLAIYEKSFLHLLIKGEKIESVEKLKELLEKYNCFINNNIVIMGYIRIGRIDWGMQKKIQVDKADIQSLKERLCKVGAAFDIQENRLIVIYQGDQSQLNNLNSQYSIKRQLNEINEELSVKGLSIMAGISDAIGIKDIHLAYRHANDALDSAYYGKSGDCILYVGAGNKQAGEFKEDIQKRLRDKILQAYKQKSKQMIREAFAELRALGEKERYRRGEMIAFLKRCYLLLLQHGTIESSPEFERRVIDDAMYFEKGIQEFEEYLDWSLKGENIEEKEHSILIRNICEYLEEHYGEPISVESIGEVFGRTPNYISAKFKREVGKSFTDYLMNLRIQKSVTMLKYTNIPINEIARKTGFGSYAYFSRIFHRCTGKSAGSYRKEV